MSDTEIIQSDNFIQVNAIYDYLAKYIYPAIDADCIQYGNQNNVVLPEDTNDYCIFFMKTALRQQQQLKNTILKRTVNTKRQKKRLFSELISMLTV